MSVRTSPRRAGISLLTVLAGIVVLGFLAVVAIPGYFNRHDVTLENACRLVSRDLRTLQNRAALEKLTVRMVFDPDGWRALDTNGKPVAGPGESYPVVRRFEGEGVFSGVVIERIDLGGDHELSIDRRGLVDNHGELDISFRGQVRRVKIHRGSGDISVAPLER